MVQTSMMPLRGMRDFFPEDMAYRRWFVETLRNVSDIYGFQEYDGPLLEDIALYAKKSGEEIVNQQSYTFTDRGGEQVVIRPEMTPTLARMVAQKFQELKRPIKWYSFPLCLRYEKPQKGRLREFMQYNIDILGVKEQTADAELLAFAVDLMHAFGLNDNEFTIRLNNRKYLAHMLKEIGIDESLFGSLLPLIDRKEKVSEETFREELGRLGLTKQQQSRFIEVLESKEVPDYPEIIELYKLLNEYGIAKQVTFDPSIVRGLAYYTSTVFELWANTPNLRRSLFGGGRYDGLVSLFGKGDMPAIGFALSDVVLAALLKELNKFPQLNVHKTSIFVTTFFDNDSLIGYAANIAQKLRQAGICTELAIEKIKLDKQLRYASSKEIPFVIVAGENEMKEEAVLIRDMRTRTQEKVACSNLLSFLQDKML